jgi:hypothetical protein
MEAPSPERIMQIGLGFWASKTLLSAVEIEVFTQLAGGSADFETLRGRLGLHTRAARDFLDALVALGFLRRKDGQYSNTAETDLFLDKRKPTYLGGILEMSNNRLYGFRKDLTPALRTGMPQNEAKTGEEPFFTVLYADPQRLKEFLRAMSGLSRPANLAIARQLSWENYATYVDVGTAQGDLAVQIALQHSHLTGIGFDLPEVGPIFEEYIRESRLADRVRFIGGNFFTDPLPKADVVSMGHILHDWNLEEKMMLLAKAYEALPDGGAVVIYDSVIDADRSKNSFGLLMSLNMLIETPGGFDYTGADCEGWMRQVGFRQTRVEHLVGPDSMVVGIK